MDKILVYNAQTKKYTYEELTNFKSPEQTEKQKTKAEKEMQIMENDQRSAFEFLKDNRAKIYGELTDNGDITTKKYVDDNVATLSTLISNNTNFINKTTNSLTSHIKTQATNILSGHVIVDSTISDTSVNPLQNKVIKKYVDDNVATLNAKIIQIPEYNNLSGKNKTLTNISQINGAIKATFEDIEINQSQVVDLTQDLENLKNLISNESDSRAIKDTEIENKISEESSIRAAQDAIVLSSSQSYTDTEITELVSNYNLDLLKTLPTDTSKIYVIGYNNETSKWEFIPIDEEVLKSNEE